MVQNIVHHGGESRQQGLEVASHMTHIHRDREEGSADCPFSVLCS